MNETEWLGLIEHLSKLARKALHDVEFLGNSCRLRDASIENLRAENCQLKEQLAEAQRNSIKHPHLRLVGVKEPSDDDDS